MTKSELYDGYYKKFKESVDSLKYILEEDGFDVIYPTDNGGAGMYNIVVGCNVKSRIEKLQNDQSYKEFILRLKQDSQYIKLKLFGYIFETKGSPWRSD